VDAATGGAPSLAGVARLCTLAASCGAQLSSPIVLSASACSSTVLEAWPEDPVTAHFVACAGATSCASLFACLGSDLILLKRFSPGSLCQGDFIAADGHRYDCRAVGLTCVHEIIGERAYCALRACGATATVSCRGTVLERCNDNVYSEVDCAASGATCAGGQCVGAGAACDPVRTPGTCAGSVSRVCVNGGLAVYDCSRELLRTECVNGMCEYPIGAGGDCLIGNSMCDGSNAIVCAGPGGGSWRTVDCRALGFNGCVLPTNSSEVICR
jgi:hypothetical protein